MDKKSSSVVAFCCSVAACSYVNSWRVPSTLRCPPLPCLSEAFIPNAITTFPIFWPSARGILTSAIVSSLVPYHTSGIYIPHLHTTYEKLSNNLSYGSLGALLALVPYYASLLSFTVSFLHAPSKTLRRLLFQYRNLVEKVSLSDGGVVTLVWSTELPISSGDQIVLILPGLNNSSETGFIRVLQRRLTSAMEAEGKRPHVAVLDMRHTGTAKGGDNDVPKPFSAASWKDLYDVFAHLNERYGGAPVHLVSQSLGAGITLKFLGQENVPRELRSATAVSPPVSYAGISRHLNRGLSALMTIPMKISFLLNSTLRNAVPSVPAVVKSLTMRHFERHTICPLEGFKDEFDYYRQNEPSCTMPNITVPTLILASRDDPICPPPPDSVSSAFVALCTTDFGGHLGFFDFWGRRWCDTVICEHVLYRIRKNHNCDSEEAAAGKQYEKVVSKRWPSLRGIVMGF